MLTSSVSPVIIVTNHPSEVSLGTRPAPAVGRVFFLPAQTVSLPPKPVTARVLSPLAASEQFQSHLFRLLTSSVSRVIVVNDHAREGSLATCPAPVAGRVFFLPSMHIACETTADSASVPDNRTHFCRNLQSQVAKPSVATASDDLAASVSDS